MMQNMEIWKKKLSCISTIKQQQNKNCLFVFVLNSLGWLNIVVTLQNLDLKTFIPEAATGVVI